MKMNNKIKIAIILLVLSILAGIASSSTQGSGTATSTSVGVPPLMPAPPVPDVWQGNNFTKIEISPSFSQLSLQPGESKEITVIVKNRDTKAIDAQPNVVIPSYSQYTMDKDWVAVTPQSAEISAGGSQTFTIKTSVPKDASLGSYNAQIAFTSEVIPSSYPQPFPTYVHSFQLSLNVWTPPKIQIMPSYIQDQLQAGKEYNYEIQLKNIGNKDIGISPKLDGTMPYPMMVPYPYPITPPLTEDDINITSPQSVPAGATVTVNIHIKVPPDAQGNYNGWIDLGIDDPSVQEFQGRVNLNFNIWKQPIEPFVKNFNLTQDAPITIEISSSASPYPLFAEGGGGTGISKEPSFNVTIVGPNGNIEPTVTKTVIRGSVSMGDNMPPWETESIDIYREMGTQYAVTYSVNGTAGQWTMKILPTNTQSFSYTITIGG